MEAKDSSISWWQRSLRFDRRWVALSKFDYVKKKKNIDEGKRKIKDKTERGWTTPAHTYELAVLKGNERLIAWSAGGAAPVSG